MELTLIKPMESFILYHIIYLSTIQKPHGNYFKPRGN